MYAVAHMLKHSVPVTHTHSQAGPHTCDAHIKLIKLHRGTCLRAIWETAQSIWYKKKVCTCWQVGENVPARQTWIMEASRGRKLWWLILLWNNSKVKKKEKKKKRGRVCEWGCNKLHAPLEMCFLETRVTRNETNQMGNLGWDVGVRRSTRVVQCLNHTVHPGTAGRPGV